ncbi:hypothetical protein [Psychroserpens sp.]|uniref:hypothetical protein n=1 Tax=Psychroserpens sp. TaxID=2020870 RepID=UPI00385F11B9
MKKLIFILSLLLLVTCKNDDDNNNNNINNCNFLQNIGVNRAINLNLPQFSQLQFTSEIVFIPNEGNGGIYVINVGGSFRAYDAFDPNHIPENCSFMSRTGTFVTCGCDDANSYNLFTGFSDGGQLPCALQEYRVTANGNELTISN